MKKKKEETVLITRDELECFKKEANRKGVAVWSNDTWPGSQGVEITRKELEQFKKLSEGSCKWDGDTWPGSDANA